MKPKRKTQPVVTTVAFVAVLTLFTLWLGVFPVHAQGGTWEELVLTPAPTPRYGHTMVAMGSNPFLFGGMAQTGSQHRAPIVLAPQNDLWAFDLFTPQWVQITAPEPKPSARSMHAALAWGGRMYVFGGLNASNNVLGDLWSYEPVGNVWEQLALTGGPPARQLHQFVALDDMMRLVVLGGKDQSDNPLNDVWIYNPFTDTWTQGASYPYGNDLYDFAAVAFGNQVLVLNLGGTQIPAYDAESNTWSMVTTSGGPPPRRRGAGVAGGGNKGWIIGGASEGGAAMRDFWQVELKIDAVWLWEHMNDMEDWLFWLAAAWVAQNPTRTQAPGTGSGQLLVFGGQDNSGQPKGSTYRYVLPSTPYRLYLPLVVR